MVGSNAVVDNLQLLPRGGARFYWYLWDFVTKVTGPGNKACISKCTLRTREGATEKHEVNEES